MQVQLISINANFYMQSVSKNVKTHCDFCVISDKATYITIQWMTTYMAHT